MSTQKHTPGPWKAVKDETRNAYAWNVEGAPGIVPVIARLALIDAGAQIEPNAHLIAAAPAMYEALKDALSCIEQTLSRKEINERRDRINAALAQAEGE